MKYKKRDFRSANLEAVNNSQFTASKTCLALLAKMQNYFAVISSSRVAHNDSILNLKTTIFHLNKKQVYENVEFFAVWLSCGYTDVKNNINKSILLIVMFFHIHTKSVSYIV